MVELRRRRYRIEWTSEGNQKQQNHSGFRKMAGYCHVRSSGSLQREIPQTQKTVRLEYVRRRYSFSVNKSGVWVVRKRGWQCRRSGREALNRFTESVCRGIKPGGTTGTSFSLLSQQFRNSILPGQEFFVFPGEGADMIRKHRYWRTAD